MTTHTFPHLQPKTRHVMAASVGAIALALVLLLIVGLAYLRTTMRSTAPEASQPAVTAYRHTSDAPYASDAYVDYRWPASGQPAVTTYRHTSDAPYASDAYVDYLWPESAR